MKSIIYIIFGLCGFNFANAQMTISSTSPGSIKTTISSYYFTIKGSGFRYASGQPADTNVSPTVLVGGKSCSVVYSSSTYIYCRGPLFSTAGSYDAVVKRGSYIATKANALAVTLATTSTTSTTTSTYTYPTITSYSSTTCSPGAQRTCYLGCDTGTQTCSSTGSWGTCQASSTSSADQVVHPPSIYSTFYKKCVSANGLPILSSTAVPDQALFEAKRLTIQMTEKRPDLLKTLISKKIRTAIMSKYEVTTDIPEHSDLTPKEYWDSRARGLGATLSRPATSGAEENLMCYSSTQDRYYGECIYVHEFSHTIHLGIKQSDSALASRISSAYNNAKSKNLWSNTYAATNVEEYFAEATQSWFDCNQKGPIGGNGIHNNIRTRDLLKAYDQTIAQIMAEVYGDTAWRYYCPAR